jgi:hypothetical protein
MKGIYPTLSHSILLLLGLTAMSLVVVSVYSSLSSTEKNLVSVELNFIADSARDKILETYSFVNQSSDYERGLFYLDLPEEIGNKKYTITLKQNELMVNITVKDEQLSASRQLPIDAELVGSSFMPACVRVEKQNSAQSTYKIVEIVSCGVPQWFNSYINSTLVGTSVLHALKWSSNDGLSGYIFSFDNCTGTFVNDTWTNDNGLFIGTEAWSNVTKKISSNIGCTVRWKIYTNNSNNVWSASPEFSYITTSGADLALWFKLNENSGTTAYDSSIYKNNGTILNYTTQCSNPPTFGCPKWVTGIYGSAINFSEPFNKINVSDRPELHLTNNFTIEFWMKPFDLNPVNNYMLCKCTSTCGDGNNDWAIIWGWNSTYPNGIEFYAQGYSGSEPRNNSLIIISDNTIWHHMAYTYNGSQWSGYRDGLLNFSFVRFFSLRVQTITWFSVDAPFMPESWPFYRGMLDDIRIYNRSLSQAEINADMNSD